VLAWGVSLAVFLPMVIAVVAGLGALLASLGDAAGAAACGRVALVCGAGWFLALVGTVTACGIIALDGRAPPSHGPSDGATHSPADQDARQ